MITLRKTIFMTFALIMLMLSFTAIASASEKGHASWYGEVFHGKKTASGEVFNMYDYTAAHNDYEFGTKLRVTNVENNKSVVVRVNDRGPYSGNRIIDLSKKAFSEIASLDDGVIKVKVEKVSDDIDTPVEDHTDDEVVIDDDYDDDDDIHIDMGDSDAEDELTQEDDEDPRLKYYYRVQFGAFSIRNNAIKYAKELINKNIKVKVYKVKYKSGKEYYKIISDKRYDKLENAYSKIDAYKRAGLDCFVVKLNF